MAPTTAFANHFPIVGRQHERARLRELLDDAVAGHDSLVLISGEAGIGKTTLVDDLIVAATERDCLVLFGGCYDLTTTPPYGPWIEILDAYRQAGSLPSVPDVLSDKDGIDQVGSQEQLFRIIAGFVRDITASTTLVLVLEDLHWADHASIELLRYLARQVPQWHLLLVASYRDEELDRDHPLFTMLPVLVREARAERIELRRLAIEEIGTLLRYQYALGGDDRNALASYLLKHTEGNPLFVVELLRSLERERVIVETEGGWQVGALDRIVPPPLVVQMIERHLSELEPDTREALEVAAVLGQELEVVLWGRLAGLEEAQQLTIIEQALDARLIETHGDQGLRFRHALIREVLYQGLLFPKRQRLHRVAAEMLIERGSPDPDVVAHHFQRAEDERAVEWLVRTARRAARAWSRFVAVERLKTALQMLGTEQKKLRERAWLLTYLTFTERSISAHEAVGHAEEAAQIACEIDDELLLAWIPWVLGQTRFFAGENGLSELQQGWMALRSLTTDQLNCIRTNLGGVIFQPDDLPYYESTVAIFQASLGHYREALITADRVLRLPLPRSRSTWNEWGHAEAGKAIAQMALAEPEEALAAIRRTRSAYRKSGHDWNAALCGTVELQYVNLCYQTDDLARRKRLASNVEAMWTKVTDFVTQLPARYGLLPLLVIEGNWIEARQIAKPSASADLMFNSIAMCALGVIARAQGNRDLAWQQVTAGIPGGPDAESGTHWTIDLYFLAADLALDEENLELAWQWIDALDHWLDWSERVQGRAEAHLLHDRYHALAGDLQQARQHADQALAHASDPRQPLALIAVHRTLGKLELAVKQYGAATDHLQRSLTLAEACNVPYEQALTLLALAELNAATGNASGAWAQLDRVRSICAPLEATPALDRSTAIAAKLAVRRGKPMYPAGLTPREVDILQLVAQGMTDAEAAEVLFISPRTVGQHLRSVYNKLGVNNRAEATRFAVEHGLTESPSA